MLHVQHCCLLLVTKVANKIQGHLHSKEYYQEKRMKLEEYKKGQNL